jgi:beta-glucosidase
MVVRGNAAKPYGVEYVAVPGVYTEMGWEVYPQALGDLLTRLHKEYGVASLLVTENGAAFADIVDAHGQIHDLQRIDYLREHISSVGRVVEQGVPVQGYLVWSLLDNYEWAEGYSKRFGIVYVDYATQQRLVKDSGHWYASLIAAHKQQ